MAQALNPSAEYRTQGKMNWFSRDLLGLSGIVALTLATYALTFAFGWVYDDTAQIANNPDLHWARAWYLATHQLWAFLPDVEARFYRPLLEFWFLVNRTIFGLDPHWFHVSTVLAHILATICAYGVARTVLRNRGAALLAAGIFGLHPLQAEVASWISSVNDSLMAVLCFSSFMSARKARASNRGGWWALSGLLFFLALLTKEASVFLPLIIFTDVWVESGSNRQEFRWRPKIAAVALTYIPPALLWFIIRKHVLGNSISGLNVVSWKTSLITAPKLITLYILRIIFPVGLSVHYDYRIVSSIFSVQFLAPVLLLTSVAGLIIVLARGHRSILVPFAWLLLPLLPVLNIRWMNDGDFFHDRYSYISVLGGALLAGWLYEWLRQNCAGISAVRLTPYFLLPILAFASAVQSQYWANDVYLFSRSVKVAPDNEWAHFNYANALIWRARYAEGAREAVRSYELRRGWRSANSAGFAYFQASDFPQAKHWLTLALSMNPRIAPAWFVLGEIRLAEKSPADALALFQNAVSLQPDAEGYRYAVGLAYERLSDPADALVAYNGELKLYPSSAGAREAVARLTKDSTVK